MKTRYLVVDLGVAHFGFDLEFTTEALPLPRTAKVPHGPPWLLGVFNHHGALVTVVDLARFLEIAPPAEPSVVVLVDRPDLNLGLAAGGVKVVEARDTVRVSEIKHFMPHASWVTDSLSTPTLNFQSLDLARVIDGIEEAF